MITAARTRPVRIAPRMAVTAHALNSFAPGLATTLIKRQRLQPMMSPDAVIDTTAWRSWRAGCCFGPRTTSGR